eukprot:SAG31_NODE_2826_length_5035_cov_2.062601_5_plen_283_part_00
MSPCIQNNVRISAGTPLAGGFNQGGRGWGYTRTGGYAQCCTSCSAKSQHGCTAWSYENGNCTLYSAVTSYEPCQVDPAKEAFDICISGRAGGYPQWTPLPAHFKNSGFLTLGSGKYYHDGCGSLGGAADDPTHPGGQGHPPLADRALSWTPAGPNGTVQFPDQTAYARKWGFVKCAYGNFEYLVPDDEACGGSISASSDYCEPDFPQSGDPTDPKTGLPRPGTTPLADFVTYNDAITKMRFAKKNLDASGQPFFQVVPTIREIRDFYREMQRTNRESFTMYR